MSYLRHLVCISTVIVPLYLIFPEETHPYLDPGTGSIMIQLLIAIFVGGLVAIRIFWTKIRTKFKGLFRRGKKHEETKR